MTTEDTTCGGPYHKSSTPSPTETIKPEEEQKITELSSPMLYIHPPLSIAGYAFIFLFTILLFLKKNRAINIAGIAAWGLTFAGLATGMLWAQLAWGSYWSWDPKENMTLVLFIATTTSLLAHFEHHPKVAKWLALISSALVIVTALTSFILTGLHSFLH